VHIAFAVRPPIFSITILFHDELFDDEISRDELSHDALSHDELSAFAAELSA
jgi:hypothetical protein